MGSESDQAVALLEPYVTEMYGERCRTTDLDDFPDLRDDPNAARCAACEAWEEFDRFATWVGAQA